MLQASAGLSLVHQALPATWAATAALATVGGGDAVRTPSAPRACGVWVPLI